MVWIIFNRELSPGLLQQKVVNCFNDDFLGRLKFILDVAEMFEHLSDQAGLFGNLSNGSLLDGFVLLGMPLGHAPVDAVGSVAAAN